MRTLSRRGFLGPAALLLAAVFFVAQAFACCQANARIGRSLVSLFARTSPPAHACCAKANPAPPVKDACAGQCCLQKAVQHAPQLASVAFELPQLPGSPALLAPAIEPSGSRGEWSPAVIDSGPPLYLRTLRLLI